jgi:hypothetical protein
MSKKNVRINVPKNPDKLIALAALIVDKHAKDGANSKLSGLDMSTMTGLLNDALKDNTQLIQMRKDAETLTEKRDYELGIYKTQTLDSAGTVRFFVASVRDTLLGAFKGQEQKLGDWGFVVNHSPKTKTTATITNV